jgi:hypothetical protein
MKRFLTLFILLAISTATFAQKFNIVGTLADSAGKAMENATVLILNAKDSSLASFGRSKNDGTFEVRNVATGQAYLLKITFVGYEPYFQDIPKDVTLNAAGKFEVGGIRMTPLSKMLNEAVVKAERDPVKINGDTTEYNAASFKTQPNATVEDLMKKLPGMEVERDGTVKAQGETVQQVLVNGKKFFGKDPKIAMQNLPAGAVDKVKVYDKKSDQTEFSGVDDGEREKTVDIQLKKDYSQGTFGNVTGGAGLDVDNLTRFNGKGTVNRFTKKEQFSILGMANNTNKAGFSFEDYMGFTGMNRQMMGGGGGRAMTFELNGNNQNGVPLDFGGTKGFQDNYAGGLNYNSFRSSKTDLNLSYFYNDQTQINDRNSKVENFLPTGSFKSNSFSSNRSNNQNHRLSLSLDQKLDTFTSFKLTSTASYTENANRNDSRDTSLFSDGGIRNLSRNNSITEGEGLGLQNSLLLRRRFMKKGRNASVNAFYNYNSSDNQTNLTSNNGFVDRDAIGGFRNDTILQEDNRNNNRHNYGATLSYVEPLGGRQYLEANYQYNAMLNEAERSVYNTRNNERRFNNRLSSDYDNLFSFQRTGLTYRINRKEWNLATGVQYQNSDLNGTFIAPFDSTIARNFNVVLPNFRFDYTPGMGRSFRFSYETSQREPSITQLQPITDNTNPLSLTLGNPNLKPEYQHRFRTGFNRFNQSNFSSIFSNFNVTYTTDKIATIQVVDTALRRLSYPSNVRNDLNATGFIGFGYPLIPQKLRFNMSSNLTYGRGIGFINSIDNILNYQQPDKIRQSENITNRYIVGLTARFNLTVNDSFDLSLNGTVRHNRTTYSVQAAQNQRFNVYDVSTEMNWRLPFRFKLNSQFDYNVIVGNTFGTSQGIPIWNGAISRYILKNDRGELAFRMYDILNRNTGIDRSADANYISETITRSLGRYALLTFTYNFNPVASMMNGGRRGGGGMRIMMN